MTLAHVRAALRSAAPSVLVEAPAGTGKTFEAVDYAIEAASTLPPRREVMLLAHTNAAVDEFRRRSRAARAAVRAATFDSFATEVVGAYATQLGLAHPLSPQRDDSKIPGTTPFRVLVPSMVTLLDRAPQIADMIAGHYPIVICDEHQDASVPQQDLVNQLVANGVIVRYFGDPMQAIYDFGAQPLVDWDALKSNVAATAQLDEPQRWTDVPELGRWMREAHAALATDLPLPRPVSSVRVERISALADKSLANPHQTRVFMEVKDPLKSALSGKTGSIAILCYTGAHRRGLQALQWSFELFEGSELQSAHEVVYAAEQRAGNARALVELAVDFLSECCTGVNASIRKSVLHACGADRVGARVAKDAAPIVERMRELYDEPSLRMFARVVASFLRPPDGVRPVMLTSLRAMGRLARGAASYQSFTEQMSASRLSPDLPTRGVFTIHTAKGREFDHVVLAHCGESQFPDEPRARRLLYVAVSRARRSVHILAPGDKPSPLLPVGA